jgi:mannose-6-phosphate isomerase
MLGSADKFSSWMRDSVLPYFLANGIHYEGGIARRFLETLPDSTDLQRSRVQTRQLYVYAHATRTGWIDAGQPVIDIAGCGLADFLSPDDAFYFARHNGGKCGINTYEQAFALLAYSELYLLTGDTVFSRKAMRLHDWIKAHLTLEEGGYAINTSHPPLLSQNPIMHLFEACLSWWRATGDPRWEQEAHRLFGLFERHLFNRRHQCLVEFFAPGWRPTLPISHQVDPGHHHEWTWLLYEYQKIAGVDTAPIRKALQAFAVSCGENQATRAVMNEVFWDKSPFRAGGRLWCQTERIKADVVNYRTAPTSARLTLIGTHVDTLFGNYIEGEPPGLYCDEINGHGERIFGLAPSSTLYHLYVACRQLDDLNQSDQSTLIPPYSRI